MNRLSLWMRGAAANALGEMFGLGLTFGMTAVAFSRLEHLPGIVGVLVAFGAALLSGSDGLSCAGTSTTPPGGSWRTCSLGWSG